MTLLRPALLAVVVTSCATTDPSKPTGTPAATERTEPRESSGFRRYGPPFILQPSPPGYYHLFGRTVAVHGQHLAVTDGHELGTVRIYRRMQQSAWNQLFSFEMPGVRGFGRIVALGPGTLVVSSDARAAWVYDLDENAQPTRLEMRGSQIDGIAASDDMVVLSARSGPPRVWLREQGEWRRTQELGVPGPADQIFGGGVARDENTLVVGALHFTGQEHQQGALATYHWSDGRWIFEQLLTANDGGKDHFMGTTVAAAGDVVAATAGHGRGFVYVFRRTEQGRWIQSAKLIAPVEGRNMHFASVTMPDAQTLIHSGHTAGTYVYRRAQTDVWVLEQSLEKTNAGWRASSSGDLLAVPSANDTVDGVRLAGTVYIFERR